MLIQLFCGLNAKKNEVLCLDKKEIEIISQNTQTQSNDIWFTERRKRITAFNFGSACKMRPTTQRKGKVYSLLYNEENKNTPAMLYGKAMEQSARIAYQGKIGNSIIEYGFIPSYKYPYLSCSPDGIIIDDLTLEWKGIIEIKCPFSCKGMEEREIRENIPFYLEKSNGKLCLKKKSWLLLSNSRIIK